MKSVFIMVQCSKSGRKGAELIAYEIETFGYRHFPLIDIRLFYKIYKTRKMAHNT